MVKMTSNGRKSDENTLNLMQKLAFLEEDRRNSFKNWQFSENENCSVEKVNSSEFR
jgi:hypothetical protein